MPEGDWPTRPNLAIIPTHYDYEPFWLEYPGFAAITQRLDPDPMATLQVQRGKKSSLKANLSMKAAKRLKGAEVQRTRARHRSYWILQQAPDTAQALRKLAPRPAEFKLGRAKAMGRVMKILNMSIGTQNQTRRLRFEAPSTRSLLRHRACRSAN